MSTIFTQRSLLNRRHFLRGISATIVLPFVARSCFAAARDSVIAIGSRRELFVDDFLIDRLIGKAELRLHHPEPREVALTCDAPWEGNVCGYFSVFEHDGRYRMYYRGAHADFGGREGHTADPIIADPMVFCYAESDNGIHWRKPELGLFDFGGSKANNIVFVSEMGGVSLDAGHVAVFKDDNPACAADARYKAIARTSKPNGLVPFKSADGLRWVPMTTEPMLVKLGGFDSQNVAFWDHDRGEYRAYWRISSHNLRAIRTAASKDLLTWGPFTEVTYTDSPPEHLYTNVVKPYHRAPYLLLGFPTRYVDRGWSDSTKALPDPVAREQRSKAMARLGTAVTEALFMASRDGKKFKRWNEAFLRPGPERPNTWAYGDQSLAWHLVETKSALEGAPNELSLYATEGYWTARGTALRRYTLRLDGFISASAPLVGGELVTKPFTFSGSKLSLNFSTSAAGSLQVELQDDAGQPLPGFALDDCPPIFGDSVERTVTWKNGGDVGGLAGKQVRLRFVLKDADLFSLKFTSPDK